MDMNSSRELAIVVACSNISVKVDQIKCCKLSCNFKTLAVLMQDGTLKLIGLDKHRFTALAPVMLKDFQWHKAGNCDKLVGITKDDKIFVFSLSAATQSLEYSDLQYNTHNLFHGILEKTNEIKNDITLIDYHKENITLYLKNCSTIANLETNSKSSLQLYFKLNNRGEVCDEGFHIVRPYIFVIWICGIIDVYDLFSKSHKVTIDLNSCLFDDSTSLLNKSCQFSFSNDLSYFVFLNEKQKVYKVNLTDWLIDIDFDWTVKHHNKLQPKLFKKISGFSKNANVRTLGTSAITEIFSSSHSVEAFKSATKKILFWESDEEFGNIFSMDIDTQTLTKLKKLKERSFVIVAENDEMPHLVLTEGYLYVLVHDYSSENMIQKFMLNEAYLAAAHSAKLNNWKLLFISQDVLSACIQNRYTDAVIYYLKNHEFDKATITKLSTTELSHFENMLILLKSSIRECYSDPGSKQFGKQLLKILLDYLIRLLKIVVMTNSVNILNLILDNLNDIRGLLDEFPKSIERLGDSTNDESQLWREWFQLDKLNFIRSGLQHKCFSVVQTFYLHNFFDNFNLSMDDSPLNEWQMILEPLKTGDVKAAATILNDMSLEVDETLKHIYHHTFNGLVRKHLENYFITQNRLQKDEVDFMNKFKILEELYPCQSIKKSLEASYNLKWWKSENLSYLKSIFDSIEIDDDRGNSCTSVSILKNKTPGDSCNYSCLIIQWTKRWKIDMWNRVFVESLIITPVEKVIELIDVYSIWEYLITHNRVDVIRDCLNVNGSLYFGKIDILSNLKKCSTLRHLMEKVPDQVPHISSYILDELSKFGLFSVCELSNFSLMLKRVGRIYVDADQLLSVLSESPALSLNLFHARFIKYCLEFDLPTVLWNYIDRFSISKDLLLSTSKDISSSWLKVITYFKYLEENTNENSAVIMASTSNYEYTLKSVFSTDDIFMSGLINLINSLYQPENIKTVIETNTSELRKDVVSTSGINKDDWSFLHEIICSLLDNDSSTIQVTSVYELLKENLPLDVCHLFGWQISNNLKTFDGFNELPYFSHPELVKKFGFNQDLEFSYYLKQGRPLFAYIKCVSYCASVYGKVTSSQISKFCNLAHTVAIENVGVPLVSSSCVVFMELLSCNTQGVRIDLEILQLIFWYQDTIKGQLSPENRKLAEFIDNGFYKQKEKILILLEMAEVSIGHFITANNINIIDSIYYWSILNMFCQRHGIGISLMFLKSCAETENWIMFLIFAEMFQYSRDQIWLIICQHSSRRLIADVHFSNMLGQLRYHSQRGIGRKSMSTINNSNQARLNFYSRACANVISKTKVSLPNVDDASDGFGFAVESSDEMSDQSSTSNNEFMGEFSTIFQSSDFLITILKAHQHVCPWQILLSLAVENNNSTLVIIAACYQGSSLLECFCIWIMTSVSGDVQRQVTQMLSNSINSKSWKFDIILEMICFLLKSGLVNILTEGFNYFLPESPLHTFLLFLKYFLNEKDYENSLLFLKEFLSSLNDYQNLNWDAWSSEIRIKDFCVKAIDEVLLFLTNRWERIAFLNILSSANFEHVLKEKETEVTKYFLLSKIEEILSLTNCSCNIKNLLTNDSSDLYMKECKTILNSLIEEKHFTLADQFVILTGHPKFEILIAQANIEVQSRIQFRSENIKNINSELLFWKQYYFQFKQFDVPSTESFLFFKKFGLIVKDPLEKYFILRLAWLVCITNNKELLFENDIEAEMWLARVKAELENENLDLPSALFDFHLMNKNQLKTSGQIYEIHHCQPILKTFSLQTEKEKRALDKIIKIELEQGNVDVAYRLTLLFEHSCAIVSIVLECMQLAENCFVSEFNDNLQGSENASKDSGSFVSKTDSAQFDSKTRLNRQPSSTSSTTSESSDILKILNKYANHYHAGGFALNRIIIFYKLSLIFKENYANILTWSNSKLLKTTLQKVDGNRYTMMKDLISAIGLNDYFLAPFLCDHIIETLQFISSDDSHQINFADLSNEFLQLANLCEDASTLGKKLLECLRHQSHGNTNYIIDVELCINCHNCYTLACHVEGITKTLQIAKQLSGQLALAGEFTLMVRLLTGMKRFSEMPYIFDILRNNHRFELLFRKEMEKVPGFKLAILDYMKRFHPTDTEMFTMIALHFTMYREIAETLENLARSQLQNLKTTDKLLNSRETIEIIAQYLADAAESYFKADCLQHALACCKQAELAALQIYFLQSNIRILNLQPVEVTNFIVNNCNFKEACIVAEAYNHSQDWALALYNNYIMKNDDRYLTEFSIKFKLSVPLIEEIARRFLKESIKSTKMIVNMRSLLNLVDSVQIKHDLANELGFTDLSMTLLAEHHILNLQKSL